MKVKIFFLCVILILCSKVYSQEINIYAISKNKMELVENNTPDRVRLYFDFSIKIKDPLIIHDFEIIMEKLSLINKDIVQKEEKKDCRIVIDLIVCSKIKQSIVLDKNLDFFFDEVYSEFILYKLSEDILNFIRQTIPILID